MGNSKAAQPDNIHIKVWFVFLEIRAFNGEPNSLIKLWGQRKCQMNEEEVP